MTQKGDMMRVDPDFKAFVDEIAINIADELGFDDRGKRNKKISRVMVTKYLTKKWKKNGAKKEGFII